jgi:hypothetical protein
MGPRSIGGVKKDMTSIPSCDFSYLRYTLDSLGMNIIIIFILLQKDRERAVYGLKEKNLAKTYIKLIPLGMRDPDAIRMLNWKRPTEREV